MPRTPAEDAAQAARRSARLLARETEATELDPTIPTPQSESEIRDDDSLPTSVSPTDTPQRDGKQPAIDEPLDPAEAAAQQPHYPIVETPATAEHSGNNAGTTDGIMLQMQQIQLMLIEQQQQSRDDRKQNNDDKLLITERLNKMADQLSAKANTPSAQDERSTSVALTFPITHRPVCDPVCVPHVRTPIRSTTSGNLPPPPPAVKPHHGLISDNLYAISSLLQRSPALLQHISDDENTAILRASTPQAACLALFSTISRMAAAGGLEMQHKTVPDSLGMPSAQSDPAWSTMMWENNPGKVSTSEPGESLTRDVQTVLKHLKYSSGFSLYSGEGTYQENMTAYMALIARLKMYSSRYPAVCFLLGIRQLLMDGAPDHLILLAPGIPCNERHAIYTLLTELLTGKAHTVATSCSASAGVSGDLIWQDGIMAMICLVRNCIMLGSPNALVDIEAAIRSVRLSEDGDPELTIRFLLQQFASHDMLSPKHSKMSEQAKMQCFWDSIPGGHDSKWGALKLRLHESLAHGQRFPSMPDMFTAIRDYNHYYVSSTRGGLTTSALRQVTSSGQLEPLPRLTPRQVPTPAAHLASDSTGDHTSDGLHSLDSDESALYFQPSRQGGHQADKPTRSVHFQDQTGGASSIPSVRPPKDGINIWRRNHPKTLHQPGNSVSRPNSNVTRQRQAQRVHVAAVKGANDRCFNCKGIGHQSRDCPSARNQQSALAALAADGDETSEDEGASEALEDDYAEHLHLAVLNGTMSSEQAAGYAAAYLADGHPQTHDPQDGGTGMMGMAWHDPGAGTQVYSPVSPTQVYSPLSPATLSGSDYESDAEGPGVDVPWWMTLLPGQQLRADRMCEDHQECLHFHRGMATLDETERGLFMGRNMMCLGKQCKFNMRRYSLELCAENRRGMMAAREGRDSTPLQNPHESPHAHQNWPYAYGVDMDPDHHHGTTTYQPYQTGVGMLRTSDAPWTGVDDAPMEPVPMESESPQARLTRVSGDAPTGRGNEGQRFASTAGMIDLLNTSAPMQGERRILYIRS